MKNKNSKKKEQQKIYIKRTNIMLRTCVLIRAAGTKTIKCTPCIMNYNKGWPIHDTVIGTQQCLQTDVNK